MVALVRLGLLGAVVLTVVYVIVSLYSRSVRRGKLEQEFDQSEMTGDRDDFIAQGLAQYEKSLRRKLILLVYVIPVLLVCALVYVVNFM